MGLHEPVPQSMIIKARVNCEPALILIDSGCSTNFISQSMVEKMARSQLINNQNSLFDQADGDTMCCTSTCLDVLIEMTQVYNCLTDCTIRPSTHRSDTDLTLGLPWLHSLGEITWNFEQLRMKFYVHGQEFVLHGLTMKEMKEFKMHGPRNVKDVEEKTKERMVVVHESRPRLCMSPIPEPMMIQAQVNGQPVLVIVDTGCSNNFISPDLASMVGSLVSCKRGIAIVGKGTRVESTSKCLGVLIEMQGYRYLTDCTVLPTKYRDIDLILGVEWLKFLGDITWNFEQLKMTFKVEGQEFMLQYWFMGVSDQVEELEAGSALSFFSYWKKVLKEAIGVQLGKFTNAWLQKNARLQVREKY